MPFSEIRRTNVSLKDVRCIEDRYTNRNNHTKILLEKSICAKIEYLVSQERNIGAITVLKPKFKSFGITIVNAYYEFSVV